VQSLRYEIVDVFTDRPFTGNPLAVVFGAQALAAAQMQALAREFHLSETVFVLPPTAPGATYRARIFTPEEELPFAGHPSVGAAVTMLRHDSAGPDDSAGPADFAGPASEPVQVSPQAPADVVQECGAGLLSIQVYPGGRATLTGGPPTVGPPVDPVPLLAAVGLTVEDHAGPEPRVAGCGLSFPYLPVRPDAVARTAGDAAAARAAGITQVSVFAWDPASRLAHTRVFCPGLGVPEDPATGSAALGFGVWLVASGLLPGDGESAYTIRQGVELHRPSTLECAVTAADGRAVSATVTGQVVPVASGTILVPPFVG
jgi:trans-2,3-dihydro-3-hydroxyanthranilate isomerase